MPFQQQSGHAQLRRGTFVLWSETFEASDNQIFSNGQGGATGSNGIAVIISVAWKSGRLEGNRSWDQGNGTAGLHQNYGIYLSGGWGGAVIVIGNDLIGNSVGSLSNTSVARQVVTNNLCSTGTC